MAIPEEKQRLLNADICEDLPSNSREYMDNIYCIPGYAPNGNEEVLDPNNSEQYITESSICMPELIQDAGIQTPPPLATGYGRDRHFFEAGAIDRSFTKEKYLNTFVARSNWHLGGPGITDKFRAASGLFWVWDEDTKNIIYLNKPAPIHGCSRIDVGGSGCCDRVGGVKVDSTCEDVDGWTPTTYGPGFDPSVNTTNRNDADDDDVSLESPFWMLVKDDGYILSTTTMVEGQHKEAKGTATITLYPYNGGRVGFWSAIRDDLTNNPLGLKQKFDELTESIFEINTPFYDHTFELKGPYRKDLLPDASVAMHYDIIPIYNYYVPEYEYLLNSGFDEALLPNLYVLLSGETYLDYTHHITHSLSEADLSGELGSASKSLEREYSYFDTSNSRQTRYTNTDFNITEKVDYFKKFKEKSDTNNADENVDLTPLKKKFTNILVAHSESGQGLTTAKNIQDLKALHVKKDAFPMFVDINFSTPTNTADDSFTETLRDTKMSCTLIKNIVKEENPLIKNKEYIEFLESEDADGNSILVDVPGGEAKERRTMDIQSWYDGFANEPTILDDISTDHVFLGSMCQSVDENTLSHALNTLDLADDIRTYALKNGIQRTFKEMMEGKKAETETVLYRIEKLNSKDETVQNFYLPNSNDIKVHNFIDTQVKYGELYTYRIYAWTLVYGIEYKYTSINRETSLNTDTIGIETTEANVTVEYKLSTKLVEAPYFAHMTKILDTPPTHPDVDIVPYHGINNKLMINLNSGAGEQTREPQIIDSGEVSELAEFLISQNKFGDDITLKYRTDDLVSKYRIYRLDTHPTAYSDFSTSIIRDVDAADVNTASFDEKVQPNKKYWYVFRSIDSHNHLSYPSPVYQVELIDDGFSVYPLIDTVEFKVRDTKAVSKSLKRVMHIIPNTGHRILSQTQLDYLEENGAAADYDTANKFKLGGVGDDLVKKHSLWNEKFKIRLTSKKTGRKIDINVVFKNKHITRKP